jgi:hypothetical protein
MAVVAYLKVLLLSNSLSKDTVKVSTKMSGYSVIYPDSIPMHLNTLLVTNLLGGT